MSEKPSRGLSLHTKILLGLVLGAVFGLTANLSRVRLEKWLSDQLGSPYVLVEPVVKNVMEPVGQVFLRMLLMTVVPLVFASLALGVAQLGDVQKLGRIGAKTFALFVFTMTVAVVIGLVLVNTVRPGGAGLPEEALQRYRGSAAGPPKAAEFGIETFVSIVPRNPLKAAVDMDMLGIIFFSLMIGIGLTVIDKERGRLLMQVLEGISDLMVFIIGLALKLAPYGVFALIFAVTARLGIGIIVQLGLYVAIVVVGIAIQMFVVLPVLVRTLGGISPVTFFQKTWPIFVTAFSTSSSNATLPTTIRVSEQDLGIPSPIAGFVLPLGATMNMNGTALFEGVTVVFLAQVFNVDLTLGQQIIVVILAVLTAIGAAGVPGGSIPLLIMVLQTVNVPAEGIAIVLGVDRILDMCRTTLNVLGDVAAAVVVTRSEGYDLNLSAPAEMPG